MTITVDGEEGSLDPYVRIYDQSHQLIAAAPTLSPQRVVQTQIRPQPDTVYFLAVTAYDGQSRGVYRVRINQPPQE